MSTSSAQTTTNDWRSIVARYQGSDYVRSMTQIANTLLPLSALLYVMYRSLALPYWVTLLLAVPTAGFLIRTFIIMHDCGHGSFLPSRRANGIVGWVTGVLTVTPYGRWRHEHALHHASSGDLDRRGHGDIDTLTVCEYQALSPRARFRYRIMRNPVLLLIFGPVHFMVTNRIPPKAVAATKRQQISVWSTNAAIVGIYVAISLWLGWSVVPLVYVPAMYLAAAAGIWLFFVQHQFEGTYWQSHPSWDYATAAIRGSSYLRLPGILQWFTGNIGLHHVHNLSPRIPNYALKQCHDENPVFHDVTVITFAQSLRAFRLALWDETRGELVSFRDAR